MKFKLLTMGNPKTLKGETRGYLTFILHLAPASLSGHNVCPKATQGCIAACLNTAGRGGMAKGKGRLTVDEIVAGERTNNVQLARKRRTKWFFRDRESFMDTLARDIERGIAYAERNGLTPVFRLNGTSDIRWESVYWNGQNVFQRFPTVQFYDYTKLANRRDLPTNYRLTFSLAENNEADAIRAIRAGMNVAAVFRTPDIAQRVADHGYALIAASKADGFMAEYVNGFNGDESDLRFLDPRGVIVALYAKGNAKRDTSGFVRD